VIIDQDSDRVTKAQALQYLAINGNAADEGILEGAGITRARVLATVLPDDATNVFITLTARGLNPNLMILARGEYPSPERKLRLAGADQVVLPAAIGAERMAHLVTHPAAADFLAQADGRSTLNELLAELKLQMDELVIAANSTLIGRTIADVEFHKQNSCIVGALQRADSGMITHPNHDTILQERDTIIVLGHGGDIPQLIHHYALRRQMQYRGVKHH
jgi:voltage-gated potassium channel